MKNNNLTSALLSVFLSSASAMDANAGVADAAGRVVINCALREKCRDAATGSPAADENKPLASRDYRIVDQHKKPPSFQRTTEQHTSAEEVRRAFEQQRGQPTFQLTPEQLQSINEAIIKSDNFRKQLPSLEEINLSEKHGHDALRHSIPPMPAELRDSIIPSPSNAISAEDQKTLDRLELNMSKKYKSSSANTSAPANTHDSDSSAAPSL